MLIFLNIFLYDDNLRMRILQVFFYTALSVFLMTAGIPNEVFYFGFPAAGLLALIPFYLALSECRSFRQAGLITAFLFGLVHVFSSFWLANFKEYAIFTLGATAAVYFLEGWLTGQILFIPFSFSAKPEALLKENNSSSAITRRILFFTCIWTLFEWCKSNGFLAYPWGTLILTAWKWKLITQVVSLTGTWGISFLFSLFAATSSEMILNGRKTIWGYRRHTPGFRLISDAGPVLFTAGIFVLTLIYGTYEYLKPHTPVKTLNTVLVQQNADSWDDSEEDCIAVSERLTEEAIQASSEKPDLIVWSEGVLTYPLPDTWWYYSLIPEGTSLQESIRNTGIPYIIGAPFVMDEEGTQFGNCAILFDENADIADWYAKIHLVPFAEGIPFQEKVWMQKFMQKLAGFSHGWKAGEEYKYFTIQGSEPVRVTAPVCFEDAFPSVCRKLFLAGSEVFVNITNDSWSLMKSSEYQHYVIASYRAIECRTTLVRSTNGGYTSVTDCNGKILADLPLFEEASVSVQVPVYEREMTPYAILGDWLPVFCLCIAMIIFIKYLHILHSHKFLHYYNQDDENNII